MENFQLILENYLKRDSSKSNYALLLNGKWGIGKTYYFKNTIIPFVNKIDVPNDGKTEPYKVIYVSLNGLSKVSEIVDELQTEKTRHSFNLSNANGKEDEKKWFAKITASPFLKYTKMLAEGWLKEKTGIKVSELGATDLEKLAELESFTNFLVCFDDLERCRIPIKEVLGFINSHLVEHYGIKTLILANEAEIEKTIDKDKTSYEIIKEKVIGRTILFEPNQAEIITTIINGSKYKDLFTSLRPFIDEKINWISDNKIWNLRTLFFAFETMEAIFKNFGLNGQVAQIDGEIVDKGQDFLYREIIFYTLAVSYEEKEANHDNIKYLTNADYRKKIDHSVTFQKSNETMNNVKPTIPLPKYTNLFLLDYNELQSLYENIASFIQKGYISNAGKIDFMLFTKQTSKVLLAIRHENIEFGQLNNRFFFQNTTQFSTEIDVQNLIKSIPKFLELGKKSLQRSLDNWRFGNSFWDFNLPIRVFFELSEFSQNNFISNEFLSELGCSDIEEWYLGLDCVKDWLKNNENAIAIVEKFYLNPPPTIYNAADFKLSDIITSTIKKVSNDSRFLQNEYFAWAIQFIEKFESQKEHNLSLYKSQRIINLVCEGHISKDTSTSSLKLSTQDMKEIFKDLLSRKTNFGIFLRNIDNLENTKEVQEHWLTAIRELMEELNDNVMKYHLKMMLDVVENWRIE